MSIMIIILYMSLLTLSGNDYFFVVIRMFYICVYKLNNWITGSSFCSSFLSTLK